MQVQEILNRIFYITGSEKEVTDAWEIIQNTCDKTSKTDYLSEQETKLILKLFCISA